MEALGEVWARHMRRGEFEAAWCISDLVLELLAGKSCDDLPLHQRPIWRGQSLHGKRVLISCNHGLGDTIHFIRYAPLVHQIARHVIVRAHPKLLPLLGQASGIDQTISLHQPELTPIQGADVEVEVMELPHVFRTVFASIPGKVPYLTIAPAAESTRPHLSVGLVWGAGDWDWRRTIPFHEIRKLGPIAGVDWHVLQRGPALKQWNGEFGVNAGRDDLLSAARVIAGLDLVISVDSMPAHLAGALGVPTWTLLHTQADWRWMENRDDSPWYPTMRLFRQSRVGRWEDAIDRVKDALETVVPAGWTLRSGLRRRLVDCASAALR